MRYLLILALSWGAFPFMLIALPPAIPSEAPASVPVKKNLSSKKHSAKGGKENRRREKNKFQKNQGKQKTKRPVKNEYYDITQDESVEVMELREVPSDTFLQTRSAIRLLLDESGEVDLDALYDSLYELHFEGVEYVGILGDFMLAFRLGLDLLTLNEISFEKECSISKFALDKLKKQIGKLIGQLRWLGGSQEYNLIILRMEGVLPLLDELLLRNERSLGGIFLILQETNDQIINLGDILLGANPVQIEEAHFLPSGLLDDPYDSLPALAPEPLLLPVYGLEARSYFFEPFCFFL